MGWRKVKLGDVADLCLGKMLDKKKNKGAFQPYLANINVRWGSFDLENLQEMKFEQDEEERYGIKYGDLIICEGGEPGRCAIWKEQIPNMKIQKALHRVRVKEEMDCRYVYYWFLQAGKRGFLKQYYTGATIMHMPEQKLKEVIIDKPPYEVQKRIGDYLEVYDNLIENNKKQIKLLEEAAQRFYKEWFVDLRFPNYEQSNIVDGIPEGWREGMLGEMAEFKRGKTITRTQIVDGNVPVVAGGLQPAYYHNKANTVAPVITVSGSGANAGFTRLYSVDVFASDCSFADSDVTSCLYFVYGFLKGNKGSMNALQKGAAQPHVYAKDINSLKVTIPTEDVLVKYADMVTPYFKKIAILEQQILNEQQARDRLLPKLMNGEIEA